MYKSLIFIILSNESRIYLFLGEEAALPNLDISPSRGGGLPSWGNLSRVLFVTFRQGCFYFFY